jgi:hypothetical protein
VLHITLHLFTQGLRQQLLDMCSISRAECNHRRWQPPAVVLFIPSGELDPRLRSAVEELGVHVAAGIGRYAALGRLKYVAEV